MVWLFCFIWLRLHVEWWRHPRLFLPQRFLCYVNDNKLQTCPNDINLLLSVCIPYRHTHCLPAVHPSSALPPESCFPPLRCVYRCISTKNGKQLGRQRRGVRMKSYADCTEECSVVCSISVIVVIFEYFFNHFLYVLQALST